MSEKTYLVRGVTLTQDELSLNDGRAVLNILKGLDWEAIMSGKKPTTELLSEYMDTGIIEKVLSHCVKGIPEGKEIGDFLTMEISLTMVNDFFELNVNLIGIVSTLLASLMRSRMPNEQGSIEHQSQSTEKTHTPSGQAEDSDYTNELDSLLPEDEQTE